jgi:hypothetical protein
VGIIIPKTICLKIIENKCLKHQPAMMEVAESKLYLKPTGLDFGLLYRIDFGTGHSSTTPLLHPSGC